jgi:hypothetical protein
MRHVDLAGVAVRELSCWIAGGSPAQKALVSYHRDAIVLRTTEEPPASGQVPRRVYVAFRLAEENTNFPLGSPFVIFLANATGWLAPAASGHATFRHETPSALFPSRQGWQYLPADLSSPTWRTTDGFAGAGWYRASPDGPIVAVNVLGLRPAQTGKPLVEQVAAAPLPPPEPLRAGLELWPALAMAAIALWLAGWTLRPRGAGLQ